MIATGSRPVILPQWQSLGDRLIINDDVFSWDTLPKRVAVFGKALSVWNWVRHCTVWV